LGVSLTRSLDAVACQKARVEAVGGATGEGSEKLLRWIMMQRHSLPNSGYSAWLNEVCDEGEALLRNSSLLAVDESEGKEFEFEAIANKLRSLGR
jgi:hypothetical protein